MRQSFIQLVVLLVVTPAVGCATPPSRPTCSARLPVEQGVVFVADGAGDFRSCSTHLRDAVASANWPLRVETFAWSHGYRRGLVDQLDRSHARAQGRRLACAVDVAIAAQPGHPVYLVAHSAGCAVALAAAEALPPSSIERIVLIAPAVSADYDLRPALRATRAGIDVFCSRKDGVCKTLVPVLEAIAHLDCAPTAGCEGFRVVGDGAGYDWVRHHCWGPELECLGHDGGHYGAYQPLHLREFVLPLLAVQ